MHGQCMHVRALTHPHPRHAQITIVLACIQAWRYYEQGYTDMAYATAGIILFFACWSVVILGLVRRMVNNDASM